MYKQEKTRVLNICFQANLFNSEAYAKQKKATLTRLKWSSGAKDLIEVRMHYASLVSGIYLVVQQKSDARMFVS